MLGQLGWARLSPARPAFLLLLLLLLLLLVLGAGGMAQDICSSPGHGDLPAPALSVIPRAAEDREQVFLRCQIVWKSRATQIIFCMDGVEVHRLKAQQGKETYHLFFPMTWGKAGTYTCGYQYRDNSNQVRNSALSAPWILSFRGAGGMAQDICSSPGHGDLPAPDLFINPRAAQEGEEVLFRCQIITESRATQIVFCKDGVEVSSLKAQQQQGSYFMLFPMTRGSTGTYTCGYQSRDNSTRLRNSALSAPQNLSVTGSGSSPQAGTATTASLSPDTNPQGFKTFSPHLMIGLVIIFLLLLAAATYCFVRKGACRERCQRQQQIPSHEAEGTEDNEMHYSTIAHAGPKRPRVQELNSSTTYAPVRSSLSQPWERSSTASAWGESPSPACSL